jgi:hypothetical protein
MSGDQQIPMDITTINTSCPASDDHVSVLNTGSVNPVFVSSSSLNYASSEQIAEQMTVAKQKQDTITRQHILTSWVMRAFLELTAVSRNDLTATPLLDDDLFLTQVADCSLRSWDHYTHIRLGWLVITRYLVTKQSLQNAFESVATSIEHFIKHSERTNGKSFNLTMTHFWCHMIAVQIQTAENNTSIDSAEIDSTAVFDFKVFLQSLFDVHAVDLWNTSLFKSYFSNEVLFSAEARLGLVEPDLNPLPKLKECLL